MRSNNILSIRFSIPQQIALGFLLLIAISALITAFNIIGLRNFHHHLQTYQSISANTNQMLEIDADIADLQRGILAYSNTENGGDIKLLHALHEKILNQINKLTENQHNTEKSSNLLKKLNDQFINLEDKVNSLQSQREERKEIINVKLFKSLATIDNHLHELNNAISVLGNNQAIRDMWLAQHELSQIQISTTKYFSTHEYRDKQAITLAYSNLESTLNGFLQAKHNSTSQHKIPEIQRMIFESRQLFHTAVQADRNYLFLVNIVIAGETAEIANVSDLLKYEFIAFEQGVYKEIQRQSYRNERWAILISCAGAILAISIAFIIGKRLSKPLLTITETFNRLATGEHLSSIPGIQRKDEIGQLAKAANVFRETNLNTQRLLKQSEQFATELKDREQALESAVAKAQEANLAKSQFLANMSHELRTPMNAILGMLSLLQKTPLTTQQGDYAQKTELAARALLSLLNDILDLSKAEAGKIELDPTPFNLRELLENLRVILSANIGSKPVDFVISLSDGLPNFYEGDTLRLQQVLINLGSNAIKFTDSGKVKLSIAHAPIKDGLRRLTFCVSDTGIGIAPENQTKIFSGFTQAEASTTRRFGGTGLGLAISQHLVELMGGHLSLSSKLGEGSRFFFSLDLPEVAPDTVSTPKIFTQEPRPNIQYRLSGMRLLLVEDNPTNQQIALELLEMEGADVDVANNGLEAIESLEHHLDVFQHCGYDAILMDLQMPVMDGLSATRVIREKLQLTKIPIIAMTANAMSSDRDACISAGMNDHIGKPFDITQLVNLICQYSFNLSPQPTLSVVNAPAYTATDTDTDTDTTPVIDVNGALARMGGNKELYRRMLPKFEESLQQLAGLMDTLLKQQDYPAIAKQLHSLKGMAATMGFSQLATYAATHEKQLKQSADAAAASEIIEGLNGPLSTAIARLQHTDEWLI